MNPRTARQSVTRTFVTTVGSSPGEIGIAVAAPRESAAWVGVQPRKKIVTINKKSGRVIGSSRFVFVAKLLWAAIRSPHAEINCRADVCAVGRDGRGVRAKRGGAGDVVQHSRRNAGGRRASVDVPAGRGGGDGAGAAGRCARRAGSDGAADR